MRADPKYVYEGLVRRGLSPIAAAAYAGNFKIESNFSPKVLGDSGTSIGLGQWRKERRMALNNLAGRSGKDPTDVDAQLDHVVSEHRGAESRAGKKIDSATNPRDAAYAVAKYYERPSNSAFNQSIEQRMAAAEAFYKQYASGATSVMADPNHALNMKPQGVMTLPNPNGPGAPADRLPVPSMFNAALGQLNGPAPMTIQPLGAAGMALPTMNVNTPPPASIMTARPDAPTVAPTVAPDASNPASGIAGTDFTKGLEGLTKSMAGKQSDQPMQIQPLSNYGSEMLARMGQAQNMLASIMQTKRMGRF